MTAIATTKLSHRYADGRSALTDLSLTLDEGESAALVGPNGAGKTTLFLRLAGVLPGERGQASVFGLDPADSKQRREIPRKLGIVFQNPDDQLFSATLYDDVAFGPLNLGESTAEVKNRVTEALAGAGLAGFEERGPNKLSGGEKRRAAIATVLAMKPGAILFDEPTMFLDPRGRRELIELVKALPGTKLIATHDLDFVLDVCPRVVLLDEGRLIADGPASEVLANAELLQKHGLEVPYRLRK